MLGNEFYELGKEAGLPTRTQAVCARPETYSTPVDPGGDPPSSPFIHDVAGVYCVVQLAIGPSPDRPMHAPRRKALRPGTHAAHEPAGGGNDAARGAVDVVPRLRGADGLIKHPYALLFCSQLYKNVTEDFFLSSLRVLHTDKRARRPCRR